MSRTRTGAVMGVRLSRVGCKEVKVRILPPPRPSGHGRPLTVRPPVLACYGGIRTSRDCPGVFPGVLLRPPNPTHPEPTTRQVRYARDVRRRPPVGGRGQRQDRGPAQRRPRLRGPVQRRGQRRPHHRLGRPHLQALPAADRHPQAGGQVGHRQRGRRLPAAVPRRGGPTRRGRHPGRRQPRGQRPRPRHLPVPHGRGAAGRVGRGATGRSAPPAAGSGRATRTRSAGGSGSASANSSARTTCASGCGTSCRTRTGS